MNPDLWRPPPVWRGREDDPPGATTRRWHHIVRPWARAPARGRGCVFIGYACDEGVRRNLGRTGAREGPLRIRRCLANLPVNAKIPGLWDAGNAIVKGRDLEGTRAVFAKKVAGIVSRGFVPIGLGGGHDMAFAHYLGIEEGLGNPRKMGIVNLDAHFDLRPYGGGANSGTPFRELADRRRRRGLPFSYLCLGIQPAANTEQLFAAARETGTEYATADAIHESPGKVLSVLQCFAARHEALYVTVCLDVIAAAFAPGVSAPSPLGIFPHEAVSLLRVAAATGKIVACDIAELSPRLDPDERTAKLAAQFVFEFVRIWSSA